MTVKPLRRSARIALKNLTKGGQEALDGVNSMKIHHRRSADEYCDKLFESFRELKKYIKTYPFKKEEKRAAYLQLLNDVQRTQVDYYLYTLDTINNLNDKMVSCTIQSVEFLHNVSRRVHDWAIGVKVGPNHSYLVDNILTIFLTRLQKEMKERMQ